MIAWLLEPLSYTLVLRGFVAGLLAAIACAGLSAFVVWRGMAFMGDAIAHAILPGIVVAYSLGISLIVGALLAALLAVVGIGFISRSGALKEDSAIGVVFAGFFAFGVMLLSRIVTFQDLGHILFGYILGVSNGDLIAMTVVVVLVIAGIGLSFKEIVVASFDPAHSVAIGLSPALIRYLLLTLLALTTVVAIQTVGVVLVLALLVTPGAAASLVSERLGGTIALAVVFALVATVVGFYASYYADVAPGSAIVLTLTAFFAGSACIRWMRRVRARRFAVRSRPNVTTDRARRYGER